MNRGDIVVAVFPKDYGKPRPAVVVQSDLFNAEHPSITLCPITSELRAMPLFRLGVSPSGKNGLKKRSQIMVDKIITVSTKRLGKVIGELDTDDMRTLDRALRLWLGLT
ncbi:MAG: type II toxin-antitoxin system PemK/MazF family toxin [Gammaproteobacteria bacterium]|nr:MAG: type II toxin-antitoxin system PemK/MazF family toxin [Gammaproteobacteria bacterium]